MNKDKSSGIVKLMYVMGTIMLIVFAYMVVSAVIYLRTYLAAYSMTFSSMWQYILQYMFAETLVYLVYAVLLFAAGKIIRLLQDNSYKETCEAVISGAYDSCCRQMPVKGPVKSRLRQRRN